METENTLLKELTMYGNLFHSPNLETITETMFEGINTLASYKFSYTIQTSTFTSPSFTAVITITYKGVQVYQWGATTEEDNKTIISFFENKYAAAWKDRNLREEEAKEEFENIINPKLKNVNELTNAELFRQYPNLTFLANK